MIRTRITTSEERSQWQDKRAARRFQSNPSIRWRAAAMTDRGRMFARPLGCARVHGQPPRGRHSSRGRQDEARPSHIWIRGRPRIRLCAGECARHVLGPRPARIGTRRDANKARV
ncbi:Hypothetical predicted protein, partial [Olea europaea subsp. europaea]